MDFKVKNIVLNDSQTVLINKLKQGDSYALMDWLVDSPNKDEIWTVLASIFKEPDLDKETHLLLKAYRKCFSKNERVPLHGITHVIAYEGFDKHMYDLRLLGFDLEEVVWIENYEATPVTEAVRGEQKECLDLLLEDDVSLTGLYEIDGEIDECLGEIENNFVSPLLTVFKSKWRHFLEEYGSYIDAELGDDYEGYTLLSYFIENGKFDDAEAILDMGASWDVIVRNGRVLVHEIYDEIHYHFTFLKEQNKPIYDNHRGCLILKFLLEHADETLPVKDQLGLTLAHKLEKSPFPEVQSLIEGHTKAIDIVLSDQDISFENSQYSFDDIQPLLMAIANSRVDIPSVRLIELLACLDADHGSEEDQLGLFDSNLKYDVEGELCEGDTLFLKPYKPLIVFEETSEALIIKTSRNVEVPEHREKVELRFLENRGWPYKEVIEYLIEYSKHCLGECKFCKQQIISSEHYIVETCDPCAQLFQGRKAAQKLKVDVSWLEKLWAFSDAHEIVEGFEKRGGFSQVEGAESQFIEGTFHAWWNNHFPELMMQRSIVKPDSDQEPIIVLASEGFGVKALYDLASSLTNKVVVISTHAFNQFKKLNPDFSHDSYIHFWSFFAPVEKNAQYRSKHYHGSRMAESFARGGSCDFIFENENLIPLEETHDSWVE